MHGMTNLRRRSTSSRNPASARSPPSRSASMECPRVAPPLPRERYARLLPRSGPMYAKSLNSRPERAPPPRPCEGKREEIDDSRDLEDAATGPGGQTTRAPAPRGPAAPGRASAGSRRSSRGTPARRGRARTRRRCADAVVQGLDLLADGDVHLADEADAGDLAERDGVDLELVAHQGDNVERRSRVRGWGVGAGRLHADIADPGMARARCPRRSASSRPIPTSASCSSRAGSSARAATRSPACCGSPPANGTPAAALEADSTIAAS